MAAEITSTRRACKIWFMCMFMNLSRELTDDKTPSQRVQDSASQHPQPVYK